MEATKDFPTKKDSSYCCICSRHLVRIGQMTIRFYYTNSRDRVCLISIIRVVIAAQFNMNDFTYDIAKASIVTVLEPCIGLIAACLPMSPPVFKRILRGKDSRNYVSSNVARLRSKDSKKPAFLKIEDQHCLTDLEELRTRNDITGPVAESI